MIKFKRLVTGAAGLLALCCACPVGAQPITLDVSFKLTDMDYKPLPSVPIRLVFGSDANWQVASAGHNFTTDEKGQVHFTTTVNLDQRWRKIPTNFVDSIFSTPKQWDHLMVAAELEYANFHRLYAVDILRLKGDDCMLDGYRVYSPDAAGNFTLPAQQTNDGWKMPEYKGLIGGGPGYDVWDFALLSPNQPTTGSANWTLKIAFKKWPPPVMR